MNRPGATGEPGRAVHRRRDYLVQRRKVVGLNQVALAKRLGVDKSTVVRWERGETVPQPWLRPQLAAALGISYEALDRLLAADRQGMEAAVGVPEQLDHLRVALVGYLGDDGTRQQRVDLIDVRGPATLASLSPADAVIFAGQMVEVAGWSAESEADTPGLCG